MKLIFERSIEGRQCTILPPSDVPSTPLPEGMGRQTTLKLPALAEVELSRHYKALAKQVHGVNDGFYPLGSCTMKYNPAINEWLAALTHFTAIHPLQPVETIQGSLRLMAEAEQTLCQVTGMDAVTFQPAAGAHGEFTGLLMIKAYHASRGERHRTKIIVPDSAHGTNPATATMVGFTVVNVPSSADGCVDLDALRLAVGDDTAGLMLTNPNTLGIFDKNIGAITDIIHEAGGLCYYDGANLNAVMGVARPGDMGFDVLHMNLHKTMATPHGGGGPGSGAVGVKEILKPFLPADHPVAVDGGYAMETSPQSIGRVKSFYGNFAVVVRAYAYMVNLGGEGLRQAAQTAVLNANYMKHLLAPHCQMATEGLCMHEFVISLEKLKKETGVSAMDIAKSLIDYGMHPPTMYFPLIVHEALMFEPTETEAKETMDWVCEVLISLMKKAYEDPETLHSAPHTTPITRPDEVLAARKPHLRFQPDVT